MDERIGGVLQRIPGYTGYRSNENRRDDDKRIRDSIADILVSLVDALTRRNADLVAQRELTQVSTIERTIGQLRLLGDRIRTASYGYGGIFSDNPVDEGVLDQLRQFDLAFQRDNSELSALTGRVSDVAGVPSKSDLDAMQAELSRLGRLFDARAEVVRSAKPHRDAKVLDLLNTQPAPEMSPLLSVKVGDTFSVLGDNFQVDATISLTDTATRITLVRAGEDNQGTVTWFLASTSSELPSAKLTEENLGTTPVTGLKAAAANVQSAKGANDGVPAQYYFQRSGTADNEVQFTYVIGEETRHLKGEIVNDVDVEVYGAA